MNIAKKVAIFIGGFGGIGYACCQQLMCNGLKRLIVLDHMPRSEGCAMLMNLKGCNSLVDLAFEPLDLSCGPDEIRRILKAAITSFGPFDLLINGSSIIDEREPQRTVDVNLTGVVDTTLIAIPLMSKANRGGKGGMIVNIASVFGLAPGHYIAVYTATKHAVIGFTRSMAHEHYYNITGIKHVAFCPGYTRSPLFEDIEGRDTFDFSRPLTKQIALASMQSSEVCAEHLVEMIQKATNGSIWMSDMERLKTVKPHTYWKPKFDFNYPPKKNKFEK